MPLVLDDQNSSSVKDCRGQRKGWSAGSGIVVKQPESYRFKEEPALPRVIMTGHE